jgi:hypothetical protein
MADFQNVGSLEFRQHSRRGQTNLPRALDPIVKSQLMNVAVFLYTGQHRSAMLVQLVA